MNKEMELLRIFRVAAESSSFRDAAARLGTSPQGVTRAIQQLEQHYGEVLFHRSTRQVRITAFGEGLLDRVRPALEQFEDLWRTPGSDQQASLSGTVRITAPHSLGTRAVLPALERVAERHPGITLDVRLSDRISNTVDEGIDVGIRVGFMRDSRFVARKAADMRLPIVAAPRLIKKVGVPENIDALSSLPVTVALDINTGRPWPWHFKAGRQWTPTAPTLVADNADMEMGAALAGIAFAQLADYMAAPYIASGKLVQVLENEEPPAWGLYVYRPQRGPIPGRVRAVFDEMLAAVGSLPALP
ncbi:TPA: LysR family transcriptional regulator [Stenotrophomonas maltophilia]|jgi:DNA-binding transcriptional LysR family regulator|uniref:LysR family transcriptional regulator n=1 Tax=Stenotrophomonas maltophilia TaxID=40324 RepID=A0AAI9C8Y3_STEMA|nr:LysR family transcriptional regulator [Stenotrophomonas maltophilia]MPS46317.1 LysR family transcriptional regulator [Stenotrophomonas sp.]EKT4440256.1 LysR family transcriptional regulator [Stenotrophomonas maltophilia]MBA0385622.1 LysR family transcriptional regulator [Stenotrophomonas maltophilia]MBN5013230.1 LysR family transcriptional regulator [Stenotrophomonas maltophilia]MBN5018578.1 LysR family transcriptional regulator [Stenotrophomonas maltophilia]